MKFSESHVEAAEGNRAHGAFGGIVIELQHDVVEIGSNRDNSNQ